MANYPRKGEWRAPKPSSGRRCLACDAVPAGLLFIQFSIFRGDDEAYACCCGCKKLGGIVEILMKFEERKEPTNG